ncbi:MAG: M20/M25/M40 family metallo-hydrolase [Candidatus Kapaibacterium sp.]|nr:MAG: M20/M25/M40 family metallo-hydrolase [Candidatus Kapabacteria bacterium]
MNKQQSSYTHLFPPALDLLQRLIATPSLSREEAATADSIQEFLHERRIPTGRKGNNVWACNQHFDTAKPTLLLNSHHDTVKPNQDWTRNPFEPSIEHGKLYGLGSNDAGAALVGLISTFVHFYERELPFNIILAPSAEEEIIGKNGIESALPDLGSIDAAIVGEPTNCELAVAEKGLLVLDCTAHGQSGHAARNTGMNAISRAAEAVQWLHSYTFPKQSEMLGAIKMTVTLINAGTQHNVIPDRCTFVVDVRTTDAYTQEETLAIIRTQLETLQCSVEARSVRLRPSAIALTHPIVKAAQNLGLPTFASATLSDQSVMPFPSVKIGPGFSERSHTADEYIIVEELQQGIDTYIGLVEELARLGL